MFAKMDPVLVRYVAGRYPRAAVAGRVAGDQTVLAVPLEDVFAVLKVLRTEEPFQMDFLGDLTAVDLTDGLELVYHLYSLVHRHHLVVKSPVLRSQPVAPSVTGLWPAAEYAEREVYDLLGISFTGHPNLSRILLPDGFEGHPLRKDFALPPRLGAR